MLATHSTHHVNGTNMFADYPDGFEQALIGMGCFWGAERIFWKLDGVHTTSVGYAGGHDGRPDYKSVCTGATGHAEVVHIVFDPSVISYSEVLKVFFENHNPTQGNRQGNDVGSQYRSAIYTYSDVQAEQAKASAAYYDAAYQAEGHGALTTEILPVPTYHPAEDYHQQYLNKNPQGYCMHGPTGVSCPLPPRKKLAS
ncbi:MAG: peptide-methionine (S)-S-oxide reductase MsrA [Maricaulaceae bacterium]